MTSKIKKDIINGNTSLGIEFGSTRIKAVLISSDFKTICTSTYHWENELIDGYWTYDLQECLKALGQIYSEIKEAASIKYNVTIQKIGSIGISGMMQGYIAIDKSGKLLVPFRTWRNATTVTAATALIEKFGYKIPQRWSIAHLYQAILNNEKHVEKIDYITTLSGYIHWLLTGSKAIGIGDAAGMFPVDERTKDYNHRMVGQFNGLIADKKFSWKIENILPTVYTAGEHAGSLTEAGAQLLDPSGSLAAGIPFCAPEGDASTGMVATNSIKKCTGNISAGTSIFAMFVLQHELKTVYPEIDVVATPEGSPVAMVLANSCSTDMNAWVEIFREFYEATGQKIDTQSLFNTLFNMALQGEPDAGGLLSYGYYAAENITGITNGRPLFVRSALSNFSLANFMRTHLMSAFAVLRLGLHRLAVHEQVNIEHIFAHGGIFKTPEVAQKICAAALNIPVSVLSTAGEGGPWGMAVLASFMVQRYADESLSDFLANKVFTDAASTKIYPDAKDVNGFNVFMERYTAGLAIEKAAGDIALHPSL